MNDVNEADPRFASVAAAVRWGTAALRPVVARDLADAAPVDSAPALARREARWLLEAAAVAAGRDPLFVHRPDLTPRVVAVFRSLVARRARGEPLAYAVGETNFMGIDLQITADALIPRPETEGLVTLALEFIPPDADWIVLDQGTGSGAIAVALALARPRLRVTALDCEPAALGLAEANARRHGLAGRVTCVCGDLYPPAPERFHLIVANLPYVPDDEPLPAAVRDWEPRSALRGGPTGKELIERSLHGASARLHPGGAALYEIGASQDFGPAFSYRQDLGGRIRYLVLARR